MFIQSFKAACDELSGEENSAVSDDTDLYTFCYDQLDGKLLYSDEQCFSLRVLSFLKLCRSLEVPSWMPFRGLKTS